MSAILCCALFLPLLSSIAIFTGQRFLSRFGTGFMASAAIFISFLLFAYLLFAGQLPTQAHLFDWLPVDGLHAQFALNFDELSALMTLVITGVGFLIHVYATGYMEDDPGYIRFFGCLNFFIFAMLLLVLAKNLLLLFVGWEGVGLASYLLIGFWHEKPSAAQAAVKAFVVNRVGDFALLLGILLTFLTFGTTDFQELSAKAPTLFNRGDLLIVILTALYLIGAMGKSAQVPLHTWLPDAMEGPTPVSALIHAATMVTAGVYLIVRLHTLFLLAPQTLYVVGIVGAITALYAAISACGQVDLKRVLAYSTVSQLGLMFVACGAGAYYCAMFHLTTHAFMKALLFMAAGNVLHMLHGTTNMDAMGGLSSKLRYTHWLFAIGTLAMAGIPPFAAFFSKDFILEEEHLTGLYWLYYIAVAASILTAFYLTRAYTLTFLGKPQTPEAEAAKEAPKSMLWPATILALLSVFGGFLGFSASGSPPLAKLLAKIITPSEAEMSTHFSFSPEMAVVTTAAIIALLLGIALYRRFSDELGSNIEFFRDGFHWDRFYDKVVVAPLRGIATAIASIFEPHFFAASIDRVANFSHSIAATLQKAQSGQVRSYVAWLSLGALFLITYFAL